MGKPSFKVSKADIRRIERLAAHRIARREIPYVSIAQDQSGKILSVGVNHEAVSRKLQGLGIEADILSFEVAF